LERTLDYQDVAVEVGQHALRLEVDMLLSPRLVHPFDHDGCFGQCTLYFALLNP
jgi:hypothetical protein